MDTPPDAPTVTVDRMLGGRFELVQPASGHHRAGLESVLLAAAIPADAAGVAIDLGAGAGGAGLCVAARCPATCVVLAERDSDLVAVQRASLRRPANRFLVGRVAHVEIDIAATQDQRSAAGLKPGSADFALMNPPFHPAGVSRPSPKAGRAAAHVVDERGWDPWFRVAASVMKPGGELFVIFRADGVAALFAACDGRFGGLRLLPVHPRDTQPASRILVAARKGSRAGPKLLPGFVLHPASGSRYLAAAEAILRDGADLASVHPVWSEADRRSAQSKSEG